jgi:hypothetical protein
MILRKFGAAGVCLAMIMIVLPVPSQARPVGTVEGMPFFGLPYPYGYVYHRPRIECYTFQQVETPGQRGRWVWRGGVPFREDGPRIQAIWTCGSPVKARY